MKWLRTIVLFNQGDVLGSDEWRAIHESYVRSILSVDFPAGSGSLTLRKKRRRDDGQCDRNGVVYLKSRFLQHMTEIENWLPECGFDLGDRAIPPDVILYPDLQPYREPITSTFGPFDLVTQASEDTRVAIEWETGNISSSHRSMNKLAIALADGSVQAGVLIVPSRDTYEHLTDRVGNIGELSGYLAMWKDMGLAVDRGLLAITVVEHDALTDDPGFPYLPSGTDGRAREGATKRV